MCGAVTPVSSSIALQMMFLGQGLSLTPELTGSARLSDGQALEFLLSSPPSPHPLQHWSYKHTSLFLDFM